MNVAEAAHKLKQQWDRFFESVEKPRSCLFCQACRIYWNGHRERTASVLIQDEVIYFTDIPCKRVKCANPHCRQSWTLRPPGLMPRRHYQLCVVANAVKQFLFQPHETLTSVAHAHQCSRRTLGRWLKWIANIAQPSNLVRRLFQVSKRPAFTMALKVSEIFKKALNTGNKILEDTTKVFCLLQSIGEAQGYEPPAIRGVIEAAISNRDRITTYRSPSIPELAR